MILATPRPPIGLDAKNCFADNNAVGMVSKVVSGNHKDVRLFWRVMLVND